MRQPVMSMGQPLSSTTSTVTGIHPYVSPWRKRAIGCYMLTAIFSIVFTGLTISTYTAFRNLVSDLSSLPQQPTSVDMDVWASLFDGAAASAAFAAILTVISIALSVMLLCCSRRSVAHPGRVFSKNFLVASSWFTALHILNIATQFRSFQPLMHQFTTSLGASFNTRLLAATVVFGYLDAVAYFCFGGLLVLWVEKPDVFQIEREPAGPMQREEI